MFQPAELFLALRYGRSKQRAGFAAFISRVSMLGIMLGVMALIVVTSVMNGFEQELKTRILGMVPHVTISSAEQRALEDWESVLDELRMPSQVLAAAPFVSVEGVLQGDGHLQPLLLQGVFPEYEPLSSPLSSVMVHGSLADLTAGSYGVIVGRPLANRMGLWPGSRVRLIAAEGQRVTPLGVMPAQRQFTVVGIFDAGSEVDQSMVLIHGQDAARLVRFPQGHVSGIRLYLQDAFQAGHVVHRLSPQLDEQQYRMSEWRVRYGNLFSAVQMEKTMMMVMLSLVVAVAAFNAVSALVMLVQDKRGDIAVLQTLGLTPKRIYTTLVYQGMYTGVMGATLGLLLGVIITVLLNPLLMLFEVSIFSYGEQLPYVFDAAQILLIFCFAIILCFFSTLYPAWRAAQVQPAETLRYA